MYSFNDDMQSHVDFGAISTDDMIGGSSDGIFYFNVNEDYFWSLYL